MKPTPLNDLFTFLQFTLKVRSIKRAVMLPETGDKENDAEHSFQLALIAWYLIERENLKLDRGLVLQYALAHDLIEVYSGDMPFFQINETSAKTKAVQEHAAIDTLAQHFPEFPQLTERIRAYEARQDEESRFVYALDKLIPTMNNMLSEGKTWKENKVTLDQLTAYQREKIAQAPVLAPYYAELLEMLQKDESRYF